MLYFRELTEACVGANENRRHEALDNAAQDTGLQPLLPYLITFITEGVRFSCSRFHTFELERICLKEFVLVFYKCYLPIC